MEQMVVTIDRKNGKYFLSAEAPNGEEIEGTGETLGEALVELGDDACYHGAV